jgi:hypothetical protein
VVLTPQIQDEIGKNNALFTQLEKQKGSNENSHNKSFGTAA